MIEPWTGELIGRMHNEEVTLEDISKELGCSKGYVSMILNGKRSPVWAEEKFNQAFCSVVLRKSKQEIK